MQKNKQGFAPILVLLILGIIGVVAYLMLKPRTPSLYPSPAPTTSQAPNGDLANWKTYTNQKYHYQISYPPNWHIETLHPEGEPIEIAQDIDFRKLKDKPWYAEDQIVFTILVHPNPKQPSLSEFLIKGDINIYHPAIEEFATLKDEEESRRNTVEKMEKTILGGFEALRYKELENQLKLFVNTKSNIFLIYLYVSEDIKSIKAESLFDQILSTFRFLDQDRNVSWEEALELLRNCEVEMAFQTHSLDVSLSLKDGTAVHTKEPKIDLIGEEINKVKDKCGEILYATE